MTEKFKPKITHRISKVFVHEKYAPLFENLEMQGVTKIIIPNDPHGHFDEFKEAIEERYGRHNHTSEE